MSTTKMTANEPVQAGPSRLGSVAIAIDSLRNEFNLDPLSYGAQVRRQPRSL